MESVPSRIRPLEDRDTGAVVEFSLKAWEPVFESIERVMGPEIFRRLVPDWKESQRKSVKDACTSKEIQVWVAEESEAGVVGFVAVELHRESNYGEIYMLAVDPDYQGGGIGTALTEFALKRIKDSGLPVAMVETGGDPGHAAARRTYEKAGYSLTPIARYFKSL